MARSPKIFYALVGLALLLGLTGCELQREGGQTSEAAPLGELAPPTLAPLGADSSEAGAEAVAPPTSLAVEATASPSPLGEGAAAPAPGEPTELTPQPAVDLSANAAEQNNAVEPGYEATAPEPESFTPPTEQEAGAQAEPATEQQLSAEQAAIAQAETSQPTITEPVIVDASPQDLPSGGPIAANPPASDTMGDYGAISADGAYVVQAGDTLFSIGMRYGLDIQELMLINGLTSETIYAGQTLNVSGAPGDFSGFGGFSPPAFAPAAPPGVLAGGNAHVVAPGETLFSIATRYGATVDALASANGLQPPFIIQPGQYLNIPSFGSSPYFAPEGNPYFAPEGNPYAAGPNGSPYYSGNGAPYLQNDPNAYYPPTGNAYPYQGGGVTHTVAPGETLYSIAMRYGVSPQHLVAVNGLANPNQIFVGQVLVLP